MKRLLLITIFLVYLISESISGSVIRGRIDPLIHSEQKFVRLLHYKDYISNEINVLDTDILDENYEFELNVDFDEIQYCFLEYDFRIFGIYLEEGKSYQVEINRSDRKDAYGTELDFFIMSPETDLNQNISEFNMVLENFMIDNMKNSYGKIKRESVLKFKKEILTANENGYFEQYKRYKIASLELLSRSKNKNAIATEYLIDQPILYNNIEYMDFFSSFFSEFLFTERGLFSQNEITQILNSAMGYHALDKILSEVQYLSSENLRELVLLLNLYEMYYIPSYKPGQVIKFIEQISLESNSAENRYIAMNILNRIENPIVGLQAPDIMLSNTEGNIFKLDKQDEKLIYLSFIRMENSIDQMQMDMLKTVYDEFSDRVNFVCIVLNGSLEDLNNFTRSNDYPFEFLILENNIEILEKYHIFKVPQFILLDGNHRIISAPSLSPSEELAGYLSSKLKE